MTLPPDAAFAALFLDPERARQEFAVWADLLQLRGGTEAVRLGTVLGIALASLDLVVPWALSWTLSRSWSRSGASARSLSGSWSRSVARSRSRSRSVSWSRSVSLSG
jgi:hypothetical protein